MKECNLKKNWNDFLIDLIRTIALGEILKIKLVKGLENVIYEKNKKYENEEKKTMEKEERN